jgi:hypothetical protein
MVHTITINIRLIVHIAAMAKDKDEALGTMVLHSKEEISMEDNNSNNISKGDVTSARD